MSKPNSVVQSKFKEFKLINRLIIIIKKKEHVSGEEFQFTLHGKVYTTKIVEASSETVKKSESKMW